MIGEARRGVRSSEFGVQATAMRYSKAIGILAAMGVVLCAGVGDGAWFMPLPQFPDWGQPGDAFAVSADGSTVVGSSDGGGAQLAVRWMLPAGYARIRRKQ